MTFLKNLWAILWKPSSLALGTLLIIGFGGAFIFFLLFHFGFMTATNKMEICISCHEMTSVYQEYKESIHYSNRTGVRATCADCHVPHGKDIGDYIDKFIAKARVGTKDIFHHLIGTYSTPEKFEAARYRLAQGILEEMRHRDSKECRFCHNFEAMNLEKQEKSAVNKHKRAMEKGDKTCVDCHSGIAHKLPDEPESLDGKKE
ncbi:NapC/NirT family cytochrome c [Candidatus Magnetaquicoccus inordinatus]|uniref:NapC/NirT family cytochrome c n=1 Tax=Candidatus Magnetaquicoccus inordinatus TaxID=2496818 RepID=UPI00102C4837|nr:NapC/NirT family cytochrome c [Candidatus Magnetaquicoccus inordinatus]